MYFRFVKGASTVAYLSLIWLTWLLIDGGLDWRVSVSCVVIRGLWLLLTLFQMRHLLKTYFDVLSRLEVVIPLTLGLTMSAIALLAGHSPALQVAAAMEVAGWTAAFVAYRRNRAAYIVQGHGPVPLHTWISPPPAALQPGDLILTSGRVAANLHESVGHSELVLVSPDRTRLAFSSYMKRGLVLNPLEEITEAARQDGHYIALRLRRPLTGTELNQSYAIAREMLRRNQRWRERVFDRRRRLVAILPLPASCRTWLLKHIEPTGYDWLGLFMGRLTSDHWTCIGACLELYRRLGITTRYYGTGLLGFGTTLFDPIMPVRFLDDQAFSLLTAEDRLEFENGGADQGSH